MYANSFFLFSFNSFAFIHISRILWVFIRLGFFGCYWNILCVWRRKRACVCARLIFVHSISMMYDCRCTWNSDIQRWCSSTITADRCVRINSKHSQMVHHRREYTIRSNFDSRSLVLHSYFNDFESEMRRFCRASTTDCAVSMNANTCREYDYNGGN